jgi:hypothetical protein
LILNVQGIILDPFGVGLQQEAAILLSLSIPLAATSFKFHTASLVINFTKWSYHRLIIIIVLLILDLGGVCRCGLLFIGRYSTLTGYPNGIVVLEPYLLIFLCIDLDPLLVSLLA